MKFHGIFALVAIGLVIAGCAKHDETALVVIDGQPLTASFVKDVILVTAKLSELSGSGVPKKDFSAWANKKAMRSVAPLMAAELLDREIRKLGLKPTADDEKYVFDAYKERSRQQVESFKELSSLFGDAKKAFEEQYWREVRRRAYERLYWMHNPSDGAVREYMRMKKEAEAKARIIDGKAREKADTAFARLKGGESWEKVAQEMSEDHLISSNRARYTNDWLWVGAEGLRVPALVAALPNLKVNGFTGPIEFADGLSIVRLVEKNNGRYHLARIFFRMAREIRVPKNEEAARKDLADNFYERRRQETMSKLISAAKIEYPLGTNFTYRIWKEEDAK